jgi:hypothetical protein
LIAKREIEETAHDPDDGCGGGRAGRRRHDDGDRIDDSYGEPGCALKTSVR